MQTHELIKQLETFHDLFGKAKIVDCETTGIYHLSIRDLTKFNYTIADMLLNQSEETLKAIEISVSNKIQSDKKPDILITEPPQDIFSLVSDIRTVHLGKLVGIEVQIKAMTKPYSVVTSVRFECPSCANILTVIQNEENFKEPSRCGCGRKGKFILLEKQQTDSFLAMVEDVPDLSKNQNLQNIIVIFKGEVTQAKIFNALFNGCRVKIWGTLKEKWSFKGNIKLNKTEWFLEANNLEILDEQDIDIQISEEEKKEIIDMSKDEDILNVLAENIFEAISGNMSVKRACVLQAVSHGYIEVAGKPKRGNLHYLFVGDPGMAKSQMAKTISKFAPKAKYVSGGSGTSMVGLIAGVERDESLGQRYLIAGAIPLSHNGMCVIDEVDGLDSADAKSMCEVMEEETATINKIVKGTFKAKCSILLCANPKHGRFDPNSVLTTQIGIPAPIIDRCDLVFIFRDVANEDSDLGLAKVMVFGRNIQKKIKTDIIKKYLFYARGIKPTLTKEAGDLIVEAFRQIRNQYSNAHYGTVPISARNLPSMLRLATCFSKVRLKNKVEAREAQEAIDLMMECAKNTLMDIETGIIDSVKYSRGTTLNLSSICNRIIDYLKKQESTGVREVGIADMEDDLRAAGIEGTQLENALKVLKNQGDIYTPRNGLVSLIQ